MDSNPETYLKKVLNITPSAIMVFDAVRDTSGVIIDFEWRLVNDHAEMMVGRKQEELIGKHLLQEMPGNREDGLFDLYVQVVETGKPLDHNHYYAHELVKTWFHTRAVKIDDGFVVTFMDVTYHKQDAQKARESEHRYRSLFEQAHDAVFILDFEGRHIEVNQRASDMLGYDPEEIKTISFKDISAETEASVSILERLLNGDKFPTYERLFRRKDGSLCAVEINVELIRDVDGYPLHIQSVVRDISERKQTEKALLDQAKILEHQSHFLQLLLALSSQFITLPADNLDAEITKTLQRIGNFLDTDRFYIFDYDFEKRIAINTYEWCAEGIEPQITELQALSLDVLEEWLAYHLKGLPVYIPDVYALAPDSAMRLILEPQGIKSSLMLPMFDEEGCVGFVGLDAVREHHEFTEAEQQLLMVFSQLLVSVRNRLKTFNILRQSEERLRALLNAIPDLVFRNRRDGTYLDFHAPDVEKLLAEPDEIVGRNIREFFPPETAQMLIDYIEEAFTSHSHVTCEYDLPIGDSIRHFEARMTASGDDEFFSVVRDMTDRKQAQSREFELALEKERVKLLRQFIQNAAHEFRTPLSVINSSVYLLERLPDGNRREEKMNQIKRQVVQITKLVDMLLMLVRLEADGLQTEVVFDISQLLNIICQDYQRGDNFPIVDYENAHQRLLLRGDVTYLHEALRQIIDNACRFTSPEGSVSILAQAHDHQIVIRVHDTGLGIAEENIPYLFDTFWRHDEAHSTPGFGLGLAIAHRVISLHNGKIDVKSQPGQGTTISVKLPHRLVEGVDRRTR